VDRDVRWTGAAVRLLPPRLGVVGPEEKGLVSPEHLIRQADRDLYQAKQAAQNASPPRSR
jgi:hypothetical protein